MIERCTDYRRIKKFPDWKMQVSSEIYYLMEIKDGVDLGVWTFHPWRDGLMIHASLICSGKEAKRSARNAFEWIFRNTDFKKIYAGIPNNKRPAQFMATMAGMKFKIANEKERFYLIEFDDVMEMAA